MLYQVVLRQANLLKYPDERGAERVDRGPNGLYVLVLDLSYVALGRSTVRLQGAVGLIRRRGECDTLETPVRKQHVVGAAALTIAFPEGSIGSIAVSKLGRRVLL
jgi:hypothetical protein